MKNVIMFNQLDILGLNLIDSFLEYMYVTVNAHCPMLKYLTPGSKCLKIIPVLSLIIGTLPLTDILGVSEPKKVT